MAEVTETRLPYIMPGWTFVNLFYDAGKSLFYCRIREVKNLGHYTTWPEITASGATMLIAMHNAKQQAEAKGNA